MIIIYYPSFTIVKDIFINQILNHINQILKNIKSY